MRIRMTDYKTMRPRPRRKIPPEEALHRTVAEWIGISERRYPFLNWIIHVPNGGKRPRGEAGKLKALGVRPGVPDFLLPLPSPSGQWRGLAIELKSDRGRLSTAQSAWLERLSQAGWLVGIARSLDDFQRLVHQYASEASES